MIGGFPKINGHNLGGTTIELDNPIWQFVVHNQKQSGKFQLINRHRLIGQQILHS